MWSKRDLQAQDAEWLERVLLCACWDSEGWENVLCSQISDSDWTDWAARDGYKAMRGLVGRGEGVGAFSMRGEMNSRGTLESFMVLHREGHLDQNGDIVIVPRNAFQQLIDWLKDRSTRRKLHRALQRIAELNKDFDLTLHDLHGQAASLLNAALGGHAKKWPNQIAKPLEAHLEALVRAKNNEDAKPPSRYFPTGIAALDRQIEGVTIGEYFVIVAKPGQGKTSLLLQIFRHVCSPEAPGLIFTTEMSELQVSLRIASQALQISAKRIEKHVKDCNSAVNWAREQGIHTYDLPTNYNGIRAVVEGFRLQHPGLQFVGIDYLGKYCTDEARDISKCSDVLSKMAREMGLAVFLLNQFNRDGEKEAKPGPGHMHGSSNVRKDASKILIFYRTGKAVEARLVKDRFGGAGKFDLRFKPETTTFFPAKTEPPPEPEPSGEQLVVPL